MLVFGVTCNAGGVVVVTFTVAFALAEPPEPVQVMLYVVLDVGETETLPDVPLAVKPVPVHEVALVELQVSVED
jgi:hypothetical protein